MSVRKRVRAVTENAQSPKPERGGGSRLAELLACEQELAEQLAAARDEGRDLIERARREAALAEAELEASLEKASDRVRREIREASQARIHEVLRRARERAARYERLTDAEVERLAESALRRLIAAGDRP